MTRRPGLSLTEVLVAVFVMGIGCIAVLTLFPLGALNMAQAFRDDRTTQGASQAGAFLRWYWQEESTQSRLSGEDFYKALDDPASVRTEANGAIISASGKGASYPVFVDPMGWQARPGGTGATQRWAGDDGYGDRAKGKAQTAVTRSFLDRLIKKTSTANYTVGEQQFLALRACSLLDGIGYDQNTGNPFYDTNAGKLDRDLRYNWLWVVQRSSGQGAEEATVTVVVYDKRASMYAPTGSETVHVPTYAVAEVRAITNSPPNPLKDRPAIRGESRVAFAKGSEPLVSKGGWLADVTVTALDYLDKVYIPPTVVPPPPPPPPKMPPFPQPRPGVRNAHFYRVVGVTDNGATVEFELDSPLREDVGEDFDAASPTKSTLPANRRFVALAGVAEVFTLPDPLKTTP